MSDTLTFGAVLARLRAHIPEWLLTNSFVTTHDGVLQESSEDPIRAHELLEVGPEDALMIAAKRSGGFFRDRYALLLDVDIPMKVRTSSSGNSHLFFDVQLTKGQHDEVLDVLAKVGIIERGFAQSGQRSKYGSTLRLPWVIKGEDQTMRQQAEPVVPF